MAEHEQWQWQEPGTAWKGAGLYHVTMTIPSREPLLGTLVIPENDPRQAKVEATPLGLAVLDIQRGLTSFYPEIQILHYALMPDHLHAIWYVRRAMPRGILSAVRGYWQMVKKIGRLSSFSPNSIRTNCQERATNLRNELGKEAYDALNPIFTEMPHLRPMGHNTQLPATVRYLDMNPERLATKRLKPGYFRVQEGVEIGGRTYAAVGNIAVLHAEEYQPVHVRRAMVEAADHGDVQPLRDYMNGCILAARQGAVMVSPFISPKEKEVLAVLMQEQRPVIYIADNGFRDYYKPSDGLFDAVAAGRMLILSPWPYDAAKRHVTREECVEMNRMAEEISSFIPNSIRGNCQESI
jgi:hypothetical protein